MSCIISICENGRIYMGADSCATSNSGERRTRKDAKIFAVNDYLFGFCGSPRVGQQIQNSWEPPKEKRFLADSLRTVLAQGGCLSAFEDGTDSCNAQIIVAHNGEVIEIGPDFQTAEYTEVYNSIGDGRPYALGSLYSTENTDLSPEERIKEALMCATYFTATVRGPFLIVTNTKKGSSKYKEVEIE